MMKRTKQVEEREIYFFFQAEDGIRDTSVTGVQTCALPISGDAERPTREREEESSGPGRLKKRKEGKKRKGISAQAKRELRNDLSIDSNIEMDRSEERRVGKECRYRGETQHDEKNQAGRRARDIFFFSSRRRHTRYIGDWSSDVCSSDLG